VRIFRIAVPTKQLDAARAFYEAVLDMAADDTVPSRLYFHCEDMILALIDWTIEGRSDFLPIPDNIYLAVHELEAVHRRAKAAGASIVSGIETRPWGERSFYCLDLDGHPLCFVDDTTLFLGHGADWA
jgi:catechol 2,3-dioxygenase-like lactoylglutathione lyase family enzyme